uniref:Uncharacterized protein n=1 Tax=Timema bartmani TaxID=61472 RepID=A0A7R9I5D6_9NEOP|nr:unnamed protein product [Timema bartmani]
MSSVEKEDDIIPLRHIIDAPYLLNSYNRLATTSPRHFVIRVNSQIYEIAFFHHDLMIFGTRRFHAHRAEDIIFIAAERFINFGVVEAVLPRKVPTLAAGLSFFSLSKVFSFLGKRPPAGRWTSVDVLYSVSQGRTSQAATWAVLSDSVVAIFL